MWGQRVFISEAAALDLDEVRNLLAFDDYPRLMRPMMRF
jgi:hypothetical protein